MKSLHARRPAESKRLHQPPKYNKMLASSLGIQLARLGPFFLFFIAYLIDHRFSGIAIYPIYLIPILWMSSKWGWQIGTLFSVFAALLSTPISPSLDWSKNLTYLDAFAIRSITLALLSVFYANYRSMIAAHKKRYDLLKTLIPQCPDCGAILCRDGRWRTMQELILDPPKFGSLSKHDCQQAKAVFKS